MTHDGDTPLFSSKLSMDTQKTQSHSNDHILQRILGMMSSYGAILDET